MSKLELRLMNYMLLIVVATLMIGIEFYFEINSQTFLNAICTTDTMTNDQCVSEMGRLSNKIMIMFFILLLVVAVVLMMFMKNITHPLSRIQFVADKVIDGDLSQSIAVDSADEIGRVAEAFNALTSNLQEVAAYTQASCNSLINRLQNNNDQEKRVKDSIQELQQLKGFMDSFTLLK